MLIDCLNQALKKGHDLVGVHEGWQGRKIALVGSVVIGVVVDIIVVVIIDVVIGVVVDFAVAPVCARVRAGEHKRKARAEKQDKNRKDSQLILLTDEI